MLKSVRFVFENKPLNLDPIKGLYSQQVRNSGTVRGEAIAKKGSNETQESHVGVGPKEDKIESIDILVTACYDIEWNLSKANAIL